MANRLEISPASHRTRDDTTSVSQQHWCITDTLSAKSTSSLISCSTARPSAAFLRFTSGHAGCLVHRLTVLCEVSTPTSLLLSTAAVFFGVRLGHEPLKQVLFPQPFPNYRNRMAVNFFASHDTDLRSALRGGVDKGSAGGIGFQ